MVNSKVPVCIGELPLKNLLNCQYDAKTNSLVIMNAVNSD